MPKATMTYQLPEENNEFNQALRSGDYHGVIWNTLQKLRDRLKYEDLPHDVSLALDEIRDFMWEEINSRGLGNDF